MCQWANTTRVCILILYFDSITEEKKISNGIVIGQNVLKSNYVHPYLDLFELSIWERDTVNAWEGGVSIKKKLGR